MNIFHCTYRNISALSSNKFLWENNVPSEGQNFPPKIDPEKRDALQKANEELLGSPDAIQKLTQEKKGWQDPEALSASAQASAGVLLIPKSAPPPTPMNISALPTKATEMPRPVLAEVKHDEPVRTAEQRQAWEKQYREVAKNTIVTELRNRGFNSRESDDGSLAYKAVILAVGGQEAWEKFKETFTEKATAGKLSSGRKIEEFQRNWARENLGIDDIYVDMAQVNAESKNSTTIELSKKKPSLEKSLDRIGYDVALALGFEGKRLSGKDISTLYGLDIISQPVGKITYTPEQQSITVLNPQNQPIEVIAVAEPKNKEYFAALKEEMAKRKV